MSAKLDAGSAVRPVPMSRIMSRTRIREVRLRHYRAFSNVRWSIDRVTFLVGRNGAGKSTLMDALGFISESLTDSISTALERRGNLEGIRRREAGKGRRHDVSLSVVLELDGASFLYGFRIGSDAARSSYTIKEEHLVGPSQSPGFARDRQSLTSEVEGMMPVPDPETLIFPLIAGTSSTWKSLHDALRGVSLHQFSPQAIRGEPIIGKEDRLDRDGGNAGDVLKQTQINLRDRAWIEERLGAVTPGIRSVRATARAGRRVIIFQQTGEGGRTNNFDVSMMSDGTARSLGVLLALRQTPRPSIVLLDEIEDSLHPFAQSVLLDAIEAASEEFPVVVSTHSPETLSHPAAKPERVRIVQWSDGASQLYHVDSKTREFCKPPQTVGRLLRSNALWTEERSSTMESDASFFKVP